MSKKKIPDHSLTSLSANDLELTEIEWIKKVLPRQERLLNLNLSGNRISSIAPFIPCIENQSFRLTHLDLSHNLIQDFELFSLIFEKNNTLGTCILSATGLTTIPASWIPALGSNKTLKSLYLADNELTSIDSFSGIFTKNKGIRKIDLSGNQLKHVHALCEALLHNTTLHCLNLSNNQIQDVNSFVRLFQFNSTIVSLDLNFNGLKHVNSMADVLNSSSGKLEYLYMNGNEIEYMEPVFNSLTDNHCLISLDVSNNPLADGTNRIIPNIQTHRTLKRVCLQGTRVPEVKRQCIDNRLQHLHSARSVILTCLCSYHMIPRLNKPSKTRIYHLPLDVIRLLATFLPVE